MELLHEVSHTLDIPPGRKEEAAERYDGVARWLSQGDHPLLKDLSLYLQGSVALGTVVKPLGIAEFDVDLVCLLLGASSGMEPAEVKKIIGDRLAASGHYAPLLEEMPRCWRLNYADRFHLDITPSVENPACLNGGELVPDKALRKWKPSNPIGYRRDFETKAALTLRIRVTKAFDEAGGIRADIEPFPVQATEKGMLRIIVQVAKRHRDVHVDRYGIDASLAPISVILTTLLAQSYAALAGTTFDTEYDALVAVVGGMTRFIRHDVVDGRHLWFIMNPTTRGENFAEKWNRKPARAKAFFEWHARALADLETLGSAEGHDQVRRKMEGMFGPRPVGKVFAAMEAGLAAARRSGSLHVAAGIGLTTGVTPLLAATPVRSNTFYGR
ncbi:nucleotidyltransferase [Methylobacterium sp. E-045]|uniref:nucleotidyltransferase domain-containing protein n=1 Tax=Methylobacterium sp. E-045 TaxID=2836575 RepID=UPI001FBA8BD5|nr:nucleotidyltransferase [Methylobacterium sp. E-045]MCJ2130988.1 nucleotidyltransferase [Methylobacterium sp. E-045]